MNNYHYIIAGLPDLSRDWMAGETDADAIIGEIKKLCSSRDVSVIEFLEDGYIAENLTEEFYLKALSHGNRFIREWFSFDLDVSNAKVRYLNRSLGRNTDKDIISIPGREPEDMEKLDAVLAGTDILSRERGMDDLYWAKAEELTLFHYFDLTVILSFIARLKIIDRWMKLDEGKGREMFRSLVDEVMSTFKGVEYSPSGTIN